MQRIFIEVVYHANAVQIGFRDPEKARAAYDKISAALREFRPFKNDRTETIEVDTDHGSSTFKLENMNAVLFNGPYDDGPEIEASLQRELMLRERRASYGLPPYVKD